MIKGFLDKIGHSYHKNYKKLLILPIILLFLSIFIITFHYFTTGEIINRGVSLKGGATAIVQTTEQIQVAELEGLLRQENPGKDISVRLLKSQGEITGIVIEAEMQTNEEIDKMKQTLISKYNLKEEQISVEVMGSALGDSFFKETIRALLISFAFMSIVVFLYYKLPIPSLTVILCAFSDIISTLAVVTLLEIKLSTAGIAAFLMLIGYSVDTDMLLTTRVLMRKEGTIEEKINGALSTGMMMTLTTIAAVLMALIFAKSEVLIQIMTIILIGMIFDIIYTWIQNVAILRMYVERKQKPKQQNE
jgi:preprotein translocase subunit SecF